MIDNNLAERIFNEGEFLVVIEYYNRKWCLYALGKTFFEVAYNPDSNEIEKVNEVLKVGLQKYLSRIKVDLKVAE